MKKVSIIIPVFNAEKYIARCLDSLINQSYSSIEIIIIDDASSDHSMEIAKNYFKKDKRIKIIRNVANSGPMISRQKGYMKAEGEFVTFVDSDDYLPHTAIEDLITKALAKNADLVGGVIDMIFPNGSSQTFKTNKLSYGSSSLGIYHSLLKDEFSHNLCGKLFARNLFDHNYETILGMTNAEDALLFYQLVKFVRKAVCTDAIVYHYFMNNASTTHMPMTKEKLEQIVIANKYISEITLKYKSLEKITILATAKSLLLLKNYDVDSFIVDKILAKYDMSRYVDDLFLLKNISIIDFVLIKLRNIKRKLLK